MCASRSRSRYRPIHLLPVELCSLPTEVEAAGTLVLKLERGGGRGVSIEVECGSGRHADPEAVGVSGMCGRVSVNTGEWG